MPNYRADPDIRAVLDSRLRLPDNVTPAETERLRRFLRTDKVLQDFYRQRSQPTHRPPEAALAAAASAARAAYEQRSERLPVGWQKLLVLQAGIAGHQDNLDSGEIQNWAYTQIVEANPDWLGDFDDDVDRDMPLRWLVQKIGVEVLMGRHSAIDREQTPPPPLRKRRWLGW